MVPRGKSRQWLLGGGRGGRSPLRCRRLDGWSRRLLRCFGRLGGPFFFLAAYGQLVVLRHAAATNDEEMIPNARKSGSSRDPGEPGRFSQAHEGVVYGCCVPALTRFTNPHCPGPPGSPGPPPNAGNESVNSLLSRNKVNASRAWLDNELIFGRISRQLMAGARFRSGDRASENSPACSRRQEGRRLPVR